MENLKELSKEQLVELFKNTQNNDVFEELYSRFEKLINMFVRQHMKYGIFETDDLVSFCNIGFYNGIMKYSKGRGANVSTVVYRYIQSTLTNEYEYRKARGKEYIECNSVSINYPLEVGVNSGSLPFIEMLNHDKSKDNYFNNEMIELGDAVNFALSKINNEKVKKYILPLLFDECNLEYVAEKLGCTHQNVSHHLQKFKKYVKEHIQKDKDFQLVY